MRKVAPSTLTAVLLTNNFNENIRDFMASNQTFFMNSVKGTLS